MRRKFSGLLAVLVFGLLLAAITIGLLGCGQSMSSSTSSAATSTPSASAITASATTTTTGDPNTMTTSLALGFASSRSVGVVQEFGDAVVSYLNGKGDLAAVQALVTPSAQAGLDQVLSLLHQPTRCKVMGASNYGSSKESEVDLLFAGGTTEPTHLYVTILVDIDAETIAITAFSFDRMEDLLAPTTTTLSTTVTTILEQSATGSDLPVIQIQTGPMLGYMYLSWPYSYYTAEAVVLGRVVGVLPFRQNPLVSTGESDGPNEPQPIVYKGYVLEVKRAYGPDTIPKRITIYALGNGTVELDGATYEVREEFPLDASPGDRLFLPLVKVAYFGTPELQEDEYWVQANWAVFAVDDNGNCARVTGADIDPEVRSEFPLSLLEDAAVEEGKEPSVVR